MAEVLKLGDFGGKTPFAPELVKDLFTKVRGHSSLMRLAKAEPLPFTGKEFMEFTMDDEVNIVGEGEAKTRGSVGLKTKKMIPLKIEYGIRVTDEFLYATDEKKIEILKAFNEGFAVKVARGFDMMAMHGINPRTGTASTLIGDNHFDNGSLTVVTTAGKEDDDIADAIAKFDEVDHVDVDGVAMSKTFRTSLGKLKYADNSMMFPELGWGKETGAIRGLACDINSTISSNSSKDLAIIGDFAHYFKYGITKEILMDIIQYGDPDNSGMDLKGHNQVFIRSEVFLGWAIMDPDAFVRIVKSE